MLFELTLHNVNEQFNEGCHAECDDDERVNLTDELFMEQKYWDACVIWPKYEQRNKMYWQRAVRDKKFRYIYTN
jgi:hypothetical protein